MKIRKRTVLILAAATTAILAVAGTAEAITSQAIAPKSVYACEGSGHVAVSILSSPSAACPAGTTSIVIGAKGDAGATGAQGQAGPTGAKGDTGSQGPSGVQALSTNTLAPTNGITTGGPFLSNATAIGTISLAAGTYQMCVNGKAEQPTAATGSVSAQLFVYDADALANQSFVGDLLNVSADTQGGTHHDACLNGCTMVSESAPVTLHVYGFGYDSDSGIGAWNLVSGTITTIKLTPAS